MTRKGGRTDRVRAGYLLWGLWTLVMIAVFSFAQGTFHAYYTVALAPGVAALAGAGSVELWRLSTRRRTLSWLLPVVVAGSAVWSAVLLTAGLGLCAGLGDRRRSGGSRRSGRALRAELAALGW